jgi:hypothetical protein
MTERQKTILLVDDQADTADMLAEMPELSGMDVLRYVRGKTAFNSRRKARQAA